MMCPLLFIVNCSPQSHGITAMVWQSIIWAGLFLVLLER